MPRDLYAVLGVARNATTAEIRRRFRELARDRHPDLVAAGDKSAAETEFQVLTEAFNVLTDPDRRRQHDAELARPEAAPAVQGDPRADLVRAHMARGVRAYKSGDYRAAVASFEEATAADPKNAQAWHHLALAAGRTSLVRSKGLPAAERACELEPMRSSYLALAGRLFGHAGQTRKAIHYYQEALKWGGDEERIRRALDELTAPRNRGLFGRASG